MRRIMDWFVNRLLRYFLAGVFSILPVVVTVAIVIWVAGFLEQFVGPSAPLGRFLRILGFRFSDDTTVAYIVGWALVLAIIFAVGVFVEAGARGFVQRSFDAVLSRVPLVGGIYGTSKQLVSMLDRKSDPQLTAMRPVFCYFGKDRGAGVLAPVGLARGILDRRPAVSARGRAQRADPDERRVVVRAGRLGADHRYLGGIADEHLCLDGRQRTAVPQHARRPRSRGAGVNSCP